MVFRKPSMPCLPWLALCLLGCGCADLSASRNPAPQRIEPVLASRPPSPAPALYIPATTDRHQDTDFPSTQRSDKPAPIAAPEVLDDLPALVPAGGIPLETPPDDPLATLRTLQHTAAARYARMDSYIAHVRRREVVAGKRRPEEIIRLKFRRQPYSVHFKWIGDEGHGRQLLYVKGRDDDAIHLSTASGDRFLTPASQRVKLTLDSAWIKANSRYPITLAGVGPLIDRFAQLIERASKNSDSRTPKLSDLGILKRPELERPVHAVMQSIPPGTEELFPRGGHRLWFFDTISALPVLIVAHDHAGTEMEYYCYQEIQPASLNDSDFEPYPGR